MDSREVILWVDERWYNALSEHLKGKTVEDQLKEYFNVLLNQLTSGEYERISREIWEEDERMRAQQEAERKFSIFALRKMEKRIALKRSGRLNFWPRQIFCAAICAVSPTRASYQNLEAAPN